MFGSNTTIRNEIKLPSHLCGQPRRWITSAGLSPVALAPTGGHQMIRVYYTVMSCIAQTTAVDRQTLAAGELKGGVLQ
jgi:hypothetical protein